MTRPLPDNRIDIYVDGCWLRKGSLNPKTSGGWGGVIVESQGGKESVRWHASGGVPEEVTTSEGAEIIAVLRGLEAVQARQLQRAADDFTNPHIIVHTDQKYLEKPPGNSKDPLIQQIISLKNSMGADICYTKAAKGPNGLTDEGKIMEKAHHLASAAANDARLAEQEYIGLPSMKAQYTGEHAEKYIKSLRDRGWKTERDR